MIKRIAAQFNVGTTAQSPLFTAGRKVFFLGADGKFYIVDMANNGNIVNTIPINSMIQSTPIVHGGIIYFGAMNNNLYAVNMNTGALLFTKQIAAGPFTLKNSVVPYGNSIYFAINGQVHKMNRLTGNIEWQKKIENNTWGCVGVDAKHVYVPDELGNLIALSITDGKDVWKNKVSNSRLTLSKVFVIGNKVILNNQTGEIISVKAENGEATVTNIRVGNLVEAPYQYGNLIYYPAATGIIVVNGTGPSIISTINTGGVPRFGIHGRELFANASGNKIRQLNLVGAQVWEVELNGDASNNPAADDLYVYVLTSQNTLYKLNRRDFEMIRKVIPQ